MYTPSLKIRVLFVAHDSQLYGAQLALLDLLRHIDRSRFAPTLVAPQQGAFVDEVVKLGIPVKTGGILRWVFRRSRISFQSLLRSPWALLRTPVLIAIFYGGLPLRIAQLLILMHRGDIDVVYTNTATVLDGAIAAKISRRPHIWHLHEDLEANNEIVCLVPRKWVSRFVAPRMSSQIVVPSNSLRAKLFGVNYLSGRLRVVPNGVDTKLFWPRQRDGFLHAELSIKHDALLVGICGAIQEGKGHNTFVEAAGVVSKVFPGANFVVIGNGPESYIQHLKDMAQQIGLGRKLHFIGWRQDIPEIFCELEILVVASKQEAFGRTVIESMASGKPVVATRCGGPEEVIEHGKTGFLVGVGRHLELADRVLELLRNPERGHQMGLAGRDMVVRNFSIQECVKKIEAAILAATTCH